MLWKKKKWRGLVLGSFGGGLAVKGRKDFLNARSGRVRRSSEETNLLGDEGIDGRVEEDT